MKTSKRAPLATSPYAHLLGEVPRAVAAAPSTKAKIAVAPAPIKSVARATSSSQPARPTARKQQGATAMPFAKLMNNFRTPAAAAQPACVKAIRFPEMVGGVATGRRFEVHVPSSHAPKIDAAATAKKILAAGQRAATGDKSRGANPAKSTADRIVAAGERARGKA
jgi:hypothetical protein